MYRHSAESIRETDNKMFVSLEEKTKYNNYENTLRKKDDSYNKTEVDNKIKELSDNTYGNVEGEFISESNTIDGYVKDLEILGNTVQNTEDLSDIKSVGELQEDGTYKMSIVSHGKNLFDGELELGMLINESGITSNSGDCLRSVNFIKVRPNTYITLSNDMNYSNYIYEYDKDYKFIKYNPLKDNGKPNTVITTNETCYVKFRSTVREVQNNLNVKYQLEESDISTSYEPYKESRVDITLPYQLEKVGGVSDRLYYDEEEKAWCIEKNIYNFKLNDIKNFTISGMMENGDKMRIWSSIISHHISIKTGVDDCVIICDKFKAVPYINMTKPTSIENVCIKNYESSLNEIQFNIYPSRLGDDKGLSYIKSLDLRCCVIRATPQKIILPLSTQIQLNSYANKTHIYTVSGEVDGTIKATIPKSLGASVQTLNEKTDMMNTRIKAIETLKEGQNISYESDKGYVVCENTNNGQINDLRIEGETLVNLSNLVVPTPSHIKVYNYFGSGQITPLRQVCAGDTVYLSLSCTSISTSFDMGLIYAIRYKDNTILNDYYQFNNSKNIGQKLVKITAKHDIKDIIIYVHGQNDSNSYANITNIMLLPEEDYIRHGCFSYFSGMASFGEDVDKINIVSRNENTNLFDRNKLYLTPLTPYTNVSKYGNGFTLTTDPNGYGIAFYSIYLNKGSYTVTGDIETDNSSTLGFRVKYEDCSFTKASRSLTFTVDKPQQITLYFYNGMPTSDTITSTVTNISITKEYLTHIDVNNSHTKTLLYYNESGELIPVPCLHRWDSIKKHSDGKWYYHKRSEKIVLNGSESWKEGSPSQFTDTHMFFACNSFDNLIKTEAEVISDKFVYGATWAILSRECIDSTTETSKLRIRISKSKLSTQDVAGFKQWLQANNVTVVYQLAEEQVYECVNLNLDTYDNETMIKFESVGVNPKFMSFNVSSHIGNTVSVLRNRLKSIEEKYIDYKLNKDRLLLNARYKSDKGSFNLSIITLSSNIEEIDYELFELTKSVIELSLDKIDIVYIENLIDFYTLVGKFDYDMADVLFEMIENQINPPVIEIPEEEISIEI